MQVKCQICGKSIDRSTAYKVVVGDANKYFCSEEEFNADKDGNESEIALDILKDTGEARAIIYKVGSDEPDECITLN